ncbi:MAG: PqqD family protein [Anaerolineae bacterium]|nr:PqqD family protein [Anaerolineae bacterium]
MTVLVREQSVYRIAPAIAVEDFGARSLAFHCREFRLVELNAVARDLLSRLDGQCTLHQVAAAMADDYAQPFGVILADVQDVVQQMVETGLIERVIPSQ